MRLSHLLRMSTGEIVFRGRGEARKWLDRLKTSTLVEPVPDAASPGGFERFHARCRTSIFAGATDHAPRLLAAHAPRAVQEVLDVADAACEGRFDLLGYRGLHFGDPIDWHLDPVSGGRTPLRHWSRVRPLDARRAGDSKVVWELNRHQWMVSLAQAYRITGEERYAAAVVSRLDDWWTRNPRGRGINWTSSLELALRTIAWCWAMALLRGSHHVRPELWHRVRHSVAEHADHIERYLSVYFSPNTHLTGEALGLLYAGLLFPDLRRASRWRHLGHQLLVEESGRQILDDGVYFEQSTAYQCYTIEIYLHFLVLARRHGLALPAEVGARVERLLDLLLHVRQPDGAIPAIGDVDGGRILPLTPRPPQDARGLFAIAAVLFERADYAWAAGEMAPELLWLLGKDGLAAWHRLEPRPPAASPSRAFSTGGYAVLRSGWEPTAHQLILDAGPLGCPASAGHGHADLLSVQVSAFGQAFLVDPGTHVYTADQRWRAYFRSSHAHSTVSVDGQSQARPAGVFSWRERPPARLRRWVDTEDLTLAEGDHEAYGRLAEPVRHRRRVLFLRRKLWVIADDLEGRGTHDVEQRFQFAPLDVRVEGDGWIHARSEAGPCLWMRSYAAAPLRLGVHVAETDPPAGWLSPNYGQRLPAPMVIASVHTALPFRILTVLVPRAEPLPHPPAVEIRMGPDGVPDGASVDGEEVCV